VSAAAQLIQGKLLVAHLDKVHDSLNSAVNVLPLILNHFLGLPQYSNRMPGQDIGASIHTRLNPLHTDRTSERSDSAVQQTKHTELWKQKKQP